MRRFTYGSFYRKKKNEEKAYGPVRLVVVRCESKSKTELKISCDVKEGTVYVGETLMYKPVYGSRTEVRVTAIEAMMMNMNMAYEGTAATLTVSGLFDMLDPTENDELIGE